VNAPRPDPDLSLRERLALTGYGQLMRLLLPLLMGRLLWRARQEPLYRAALPERVGLGEPVRPGALWLHAVSLGETRAAEPLIQALRQACPDLRLLLTHGTATGREAGAALLREGDAQRWLPLDTPGATRRFLRRHRPALGVLMETEVWPALLHAAQQSGVPVVLANARLSEKSLRQSLRFDALLRPAARSFTAVLAQTEEDADRLRQAGAPQARVEVCGNLKYDLQPSPALLATGLSWRAGLARPVVLAASWREGEDEPLLAAWQAALAQRVPSQPRPLLLLVPRHPQRFDEVGARVASSGLTVVRRSSWVGTGPGALARAADVWLGDSMREMPAYYACADVALLGGSFAPLGGQNLIEAAACGCPVVTGPHVFNFVQPVARALAAGAACPAPDLDRAVRQALALAGDIAAQTSARQAALGSVAADQGAAARMAARLAALLNREPAELSGSCRAGR
jgi:3-deoxy-D-manno-octulosonic-acid transferase